MNTAMPRNPMEAAFSRQIISPPPGVALAGYFAPRPNQGILDDLHVRVALFRSAGTIVGLIHFDLMEVPLWLCRKIRSRVAHLDRHLADNLVIAATHTHTAPELREARDQVHQHALDYVLNQALAAVDTARWRFAPVEIEALTLADNPLAFNRRFWMTDGTVVTNPGKLNPRIDRPEGPVDPEIHVVLLRQFGRPAACLVNLSNHTDTMGGNRVSADWPGVLERCLQTHVGSELPVFSLISPAGNINHFDVASGDDQTSPAETKRIGSAYADLIIGQLEAARPIVPASLAVKHVDFVLKRRTITSAEVEAAQTLVAMEKEETGVLTSEDLAQGAPGVMRYFAEELIRFAGLEAGTTEHFQVTALRLGRDIAIVSLPGEPFAEIGLAIRAQSPFRQTLIVTNANGYAGYIAPDDCRDRGGYEPLPVQNGGAAKGMAQEAAACALKALRNIANTP